MNLQQRVSAEIRSFAWRIVVAVLLVTPLSAQAQLASAPRMVLECAPCHGFDGIGHDDSVPNLAGQHREYLYNQLLAFRSGARRHPEMNFFSGQVTEYELQTIIGYYAGLPQR